MNVLECGRSLVINIDLMKDLERLQLENNLNCNSFRSSLVCFLCDEITREKLIDVNERLVLMILISLFSPEILRSTVPFASFFLKHTSKCTSHRIYSGLLLNSKCPTLRVLHGELFTA